MRVCEALTLMCEANTASRNRVFVSKPNAIWHFSSVQVGGRVGAVLGVASEEDMFAGTVDLSIGFGNMLLCPASFSSMALLWFRRSCRTGGLGGHMRSEAFHVKLEELISISGLCRTFVLSS